MSQDDAVERAAVAEKVMQGHESRYGVSGWSCDCGHRYGQPANVAHAVEMHRLESAVAAAEGLRAQLDAAHAQIEALNREIEQERRDAIDLALRHQAQALRDAADAEYGPHRPYPIVEDWLRGRADWIARGKP